MHDYRLLGFVLDAGSWADWFAGTMSFAAVATALGGYWFSERSRGKEARERILHASEAIAWKLIHTINRNELIHKHIADGFAEAEKVRVDWKFVRVRPLGVLQQQVGMLTSEEVSAMVRAKAVDQALDISECIQRLESIEISMLEYKSRHQALFELLPPPTENQGMVFSHFLDEEQTARATPYMRMLDSLIVDIHALTIINQVKLAALLQSYPAAMQAYFGKWTISLKTPD